MIKQALTAAALCAAIALPVSSLAQAPASQGAAAAAQPALTDGEVKKVNQDTGKLTIKHGPIKHLDMPGMTMVFTAKDKSLLSTVKAGDKIKFMVVQEGGKMMVTEIQVVP